MFVTESLLAFTIFRDDFDIPFVIMFGFLLFVKCFHWLMADRVESVREIYSASDAYRYLHYARHGNSGCLNFALGYICSSLGFLRRVLMTNTPLPDGSSSIPRTAPPLPRSHEYAVFNFMVRGLHDARLRH